MLEIMGFRERHNTAVTSIRRKRNEATRDRPVRLEYVSLDTDPSDPEAHGNGWEHFCERVGGRNAMAWWAYVLQFCGLHAADSGVIRIDRKNFGRLVLSRNTDPVSDRDGIKCYDALIAAGMAREVDRLQEPVAPPPGAAQGEAQGGTQDAPQGATRGGTADAPQGGTPGPTQGPPSGHPQGTPDGTPQGQPQGAGVLVPGPGSSNTPLPPAQRGSGCAAAEVDRASNEATASEWAAARVIADALVRNTPGVRCLTPSEDAELLRVIRATSSCPEAERATAAARREELFAEDLRRRAATIDGIGRGDVAVVRWAVALLGEHPEIVARIRSAQKVQARDSRGRRGAPLPAPVAAQAIPPSVAAAPPVARSSPFRASPEAAPAPHAELPTMSAADRDHIVSALTSQVRTGGANATPARGLLSTPEANRNPGWWARAVAVVSTHPVRPGVLDRELHERDLARLAGSADDTPDAEQARTLLRVQHAYRWGEWYRLARRLVEDAARRAEEQRAGAPAGAA